MNEDTFTLTATYVIVDNKRGTCTPISVSEDLETAWEEAKAVSRSADVRTATLYRIGIHSNYGNPLLGTSTTWFAGGNAGSTATRYSSPA
jgi:hypothetical protein